MSAESQPASDELPNPSITRTVASVVRTRQLEATKLPHPDERLPWGELKPRFSHSTLYKFKSIGLLERTDERDAEGRWLWRSDPSTYAWIEANLDVTTTPCGRSIGVRNVRDEDAYTCLDDECDCRFDRETAEAVIQG